MIRVIVNGIGTIGKRVAHAVRLQDDMKLIGVSDVAPTSILRTNLGPGGPLEGVKLFCSVPDMRKGLEDSGLKVEGNLPDILGSGEVDVVVDATPKGIEEKNKPMYESNGVKIVYEGGASPDVASVSFSTLANYEKAVNAPSARVVSCNTTSLARTLSAVNNKIGIQSVTGALVRRATDPWDEKTGPINAIIPETHIPSHQGPDLQTVLPINIKTIAVKVPTTLAHVHMIFGKLSRESSTEELREALFQQPRVILLKASDGYTATSEIIERYRDLGRHRYDMYEAAVWDETITVDDDEFYWIHAVHSEAIVIPENIDCIRAIMGFEDRDACIQKTNKSLGIL